jgi:hypothetical protein
VDLKVEEGEVALLGVVAWAVGETEEVLVDLVEGESVMLHQSDFNFAFSLFEVFEMRDCCVAEDEAWV